MERHTLCLGKISFQVTINEDLEMVLHIKNYKITQEKSLQPLYLHR